jgi:hypothetical protein
MAREIRRARRDHHLTVPEILFSVWVELGAIFFLSSEKHP